MSQQQNVRLSTEVAEKYELVDYRGGDTQYWGRHGQVTISTLTMQQADRLFKNGWPKLQLKSTKAVTAKPEKG